MRPESVAEARAWLKRAAMDLRAGALDLQPDPPIVEDALFHCQQAAEKALKAFLVAHGQTIPKTHDLDLLSCRCEAIHPSLREVLTEARDLTAFAWVFRYPGDWKSPSRDKGENALHLARRVYEAVVSRLPDEARS